MKGEKSRIKKIKMTPEKLLEDMSTMFDNFTTKVNERIDKIEKKVDGINKAPLGPKQFERDPFYNNKIIECKFAYLATMLDESKRIEFVRKLDILCQSYKIESLEANYKNKI